jgi:diguanylate cyclase (GGDEF)-like protein
MVFWRKSEGPDSAGPGDDALETVGVMLRRLGETGDVDEERQQLEAWAHHVLLQGPVPGTAPVRLTPGRRDWAGVRRVVDQVLQARATRAGQAIVDLRETVGAMTRTLVRALSEDKGADDLARGELARLKEAAEQRPPEEVKKCALAVVASLSTMLTEREERHLRRLQELDEKTRGLEGRLRQAQREQMEDALTGLINRRGFDQEVQRALEARTHLGDTSSLLVFDLDHFKGINDAFGHTGGDVALKAFSCTLSLCFPRRDDCVARFGGEEFVVLLRGARGQDAFRLAERCLERVRNTEVSINGQSTVVTASCGVTEIRTNDDADAFIARADAALYRAKREGRDRARLDVDDAARIRPMKLVTAN